MLKKIATALLIMDCGLYYSYGSAQYAECKERNDQQQEERQNRQLQQFIQQSNATMDSERQAAQQADAQVQTNAALRRIAELQGRR